MNFDKNVLNINYGQGSMLGSRGGFKEGKGTPFAFREQTTQYIKLDSKGF